MRRRNAEYYIIFSAGRIMRFERIEIETDFLQISAGVTPASDFLRKFGSIGTAKFGEAIPRLNH